MKEMTPAELLSMSKLLQMETDSLALARAVRAAVSDGPLKESIDAGILAGKARIEGIQRFVNENRLSPEGEVH